MKNRAFLFIATLLAAGLFAIMPAMAQAAPIDCSIHPADLLNSFAFSSQGTNLAANALIPAGVFAQVGTATGTSATREGNNITGRWTVTITQNDTSGKLSTNTFVGGYTVNVNTCTGNFSWDNVGVVFQATFSNNATVFNSISTLPGVIISYTGRKL